MKFERIATQDKRYNIVHIVYNIIYTCNVHYNTEYGNNAATDRRRRRPRDRLIEFLGRRAHNSCALERAIEKAPSEHMDLMPCKYTGQSLTVAVTKKHLLPSDCMI